MVDYKIEKEIKKEINEYIIESLTVSDEVVKASEKVEGYILKHIQAQESYSFADGGGKRDLDFKITLFNDNIDVIFSVTNYNFINESYYKKFSKNNEICISSGSTYKKVGKKILAFCILNYISFNFIPLSKFYEDLHHELNHLLQQHNIGHTYSNSEDYANISSDIFSTDEIKHNVAEILYLCLPAEQDSFVSSVYSFVKNQYHIDWNYNNIDECIKDTDAYKRIYRVKFLYDEIMNNKDKYKDKILIEKNFKTWNRFEKYATESMNRFEKKFAMVVKKCKADFVIYDKNTFVEATIRNKMYLINL